MRAALFVFLLTLFCRGALALPNSEPIEVTRRAIIEQLLDGDASRLKQDAAIETRFIRKLAPKRLRFNIVHSASNISGSVFEFELPHHDDGRQRLSRIAIWVFSYRDDAAAIRNAKFIKNSCKKGDCFKSKILTVFSYAVVENRVVVIFTENARDESVVTFIESAPNLLTRQSARIP